MLKFNIDEHSKQAFGEQLYEVDHILPLHRNKLEKSRFRFTRPALSFKLFLFPYQHNPQKQLKYTDLVDILHLCKQQIMLSKEKPMKSSSFFHYNSILLCLYNHHLLKKLSSRKKISPSLTVTYQQQFVQYIHKKKLCICLNHTTAYRQKKKNDFVFHAGYFSRKSI